MSQELKTSLELQQQDSTLETEQNKESFSSEEMVQYKKIPNSPFEIIKHEKGYFVAMGKQRLTPDLETEEEVYKLMDTWDFKSMVIIVICESIVKLRQENELNSN